MLAQTSLLSSYPAVRVPLGTPLLHRAQPVEDAIYVASGRVLLGIVGDEAAVDDGCLMEHQLGMVEGPGWLEANSVLLHLPSAVDAVTETDTVLHRVPSECFCAAVADGSDATLAVLDDLARAHRRQTELAVSRLAKDAESRCAEWLLQHAQSSDKGQCMVQLMQRKRMIAAQLGIAPETLSRILRHMRERRLISGSGRVVNLEDLSGLRSLAGM